jgi:hypothetical protein
MTERMLVLITLIWGDGRGWVRTSDLSRVRRALSR